MTIKPLYIVDEALKTRVSNNLSKCGGIWGVWGYEVVGWGYGWDRVGMWVVWGGKWGVLHAEL